MKQQVIDRLMVAANNNAVLAAWASVIYEHGMPAYCDVAPHDHWEAYQDLFCRSVLSAKEFDETDIKKKFFSGERPNEADVQHVLSSMIHTQQKEKEMSRAKAPTSAFSNAMVRQERNEISKGDAVYQMGGHRTHSIESFRPEREVLPPSKSPKSFPAFKTKALACADVDARMHVGEDCSINGHIICCGRPLEVVDDGGDIITPEDNSDLRFPMIEMMFHSSCDICGSEYNTAVSKPIDRSAI